MKIKNITFWGYTVIKLSCYNNNMTVEEYNKPKQVEKKLQL